MRSGSVNRAKLKELGVLRPRGCESHAVSSIPAALGRVTRCGGSVLAARGPLLNTPSLVGRASASAHSRFGDCLFRYESSNRISPLSPAPTFPRRAPTRSTRSPPTR